MDLFAVRWTNPYLIFDDFIRLGQFHDFVEETIKTIADERKHDARWDFYLHKVCMISDVTFEEYEKMCDDPSHDTSEMSVEDIEGIISDTKNILFDLDWE